MGERLAGQCPHTSKFRPWRERWCRLSLPTRLVPSSSSAFVHGIRSSTVHSTAFLDTTLSMVRKLLTVLGARLVSACFKRCTCSVVIASSRFAPKCGCKCTRPIVSFAAIPLGSVYSLGRSRRGTAARTH